MLGNGLGNGFRLYGSIVSYSMGYVGNGVLRGFPAFSHCVYLITESSNHEQKETPAFTGATMSASDCHADVNEGYKPSSYYCHL